jgi:chromosome segregation ATPase
MKLKVFTVLLFLFCVALGVVLYMHNRKNEELQKTTEETSAALTTVSTQLTNKSKDLSEQQQVNEALDKTNKTLEAEVVVFSNKLTETRTALEKTEADAKAKEQTAQTELAKRDAKIADLQGQKDDMSKRINSMSNVLAELQTQITSTERKLAVSDGDREFLLKELKRMQTEKADLERQFNDLKAIKVQVTKLKEELAIARRLEFIRAGVFSGMKGGELLTKKTPPTQTGKSATNFNLNVEFKQDGGATVVSPTNAPAQAPK